MSTHPGDKPIKRLGAYLGGLIGFFAFSVFGCLVLMVAGGKNDGAVSAAQEAGPDSYFGKAQEARTAQAEVVSTAGEVSDGVVRIPVKSAFPIVLKDLQALKPKKSAVPVPGTPAAEALMQAQQQTATPAPAEKPKEEEPKPEAKPEKPAEPVQKPKAKASAPKSQPKAKDEAKTQPKGKAKQPTPKAKQPAPKAKAKNQPKAKAKAKAKAQNPSQPAPPNAEGGS